MGDSERLFFVAVAPDGLAVDAARFDAVCSPNPEDAAQLAIRQLSKTNRIALMSFGPRTVTSHEFLVGGVSVLGSLMRSFVDARREVRVIIEAAGVRMPRHDGEFYAVRTEEDVALVSQKLTNFDEADLVRVTIAIQNYEICLVSLPAFPPFGAKGAPVKVNGWRAISEPGEFVNAKAFVLLHFDGALATESAVMKMLAGQDVEVVVSEERAVMEKEVALGEESEYEYEYEEEDEASRSGSVLVSAASKGRRGELVSSAHGGEEEQDAGSVRSLKRGQENESVRSQLYEQDAGSVRSLKQENESVRSQRYEQDAGSVRSLKQEQESESARSQRQMDSASARSHQERSSVSGKFSAREEPFIPNELVAMEKRGDWQQEDASESGDKGSSHFDASSVRSNARSGVGLGSDKESVRSNRTDQPALGLSGKGDDQQSQGRRRRRRKKGNSAKPQAEQIEEVAFGAFTDSEPIPGDDNVDENGIDPNDDSPEAEIKRFVAQLNMNIPVLEDTSVFSTLVQQLFYEKWKSGALARTKTVLLDVREKLRKRFTDEIQSLKQLVNSKDLTVFVAREEQKMRLLENMAVDTIQKALERRAGAYSNVTTRGLLRTFQTICGDHVTLQRKIRDRRASIRSETMELRIAQASRLEKLQNYREHAQQLEDAVSLQDRIHDALVRHEQIQHELSDAEDDRMALLQQLEKVKGILESRKSNVK